MLMTSLTVVLLVLYALVAGFALFMSYDERSRAGSISPFYTALSTLACLFWPITAVGVAVAMQRSQTPSAQTQPAKAQTAS